MKEGRRRGWNRRKFIARREKWKKSAVNRGGEGTGRVQMRSNRLWAIAEEETKKALSSFFGLRWKIGKIPYARSSRDGGAGAPLSMVERK